jgi:hypothetical protein
MSSVNIKKGFCENKSIHKFKSQGQIYDIICNNKGFCFYPQSIPQKGKTITKKTNLFENHNFSKNNKKVLCT